MLLQAIASQNAAAVAAAGGGAFSAAGGMQVPTSDLNTINSYNSFTSNDSLSSVRGQAMSRALQQAQAGLLPESQASPFSASAELLSTHVIDRGSCHGFWVPGRPFSFTVCRVCTSVAGSVGGFCLGMQYESYYLLNTRITHIRHLPPVHVTGQGPLLRTPYFMWCMPCHRPAIV